MPPTYQKKVKEVYVRNKKTPEHYCSGIFCFINLTCHPELVSGSMADNKMDAEINSA